MRAAATRAWSSPGSQWFFAGVMVGVVLTMGFVMNVVATAVGWLPYDRGVRVGAYMVVALVMSSAALFGLWGAREGQE